MLGLAEKPEVIMKKELELEKTITSDIEQIRSLLK
jgi:hypothetical protein